MSTFPAAPASPGTRLAKMPENDASRFRYCSMLLLLMFVALSFPVHGTDLIADGGFEIPQVGPGGYNRGYQNFVPGTLIDSAWQVVGTGSGDVSVYPNSEILNGSVRYNVAEGSQALDLTGDFDNGAKLGVEQTAATTPGTNYELSFWVGSTLGQPAIVDTFVNGRNVLTANNSNLTSGATNWQRFQYTFTATGSNTVVGFFNGSPSGVKTDGIDGFQLSPTAAPELLPLTYTSVGLFLFGLVRRRFLKQF